MQTILKYHSDVDLSKDVKHFDASAFSDSVPKFRSFARMWQWYRRKSRSSKKRENWGKRLPEQAEQFLLEKANAEIICTYSSICQTRLPIEFEDIIFNETNIENYGIRYLKSINQWSTNEDRVVIPAYENNFRSKPNLLLKYARYLGTRLPADWELDLSGDPYACFEYAYCFLNGRLPESLHNFMYAAQIGGYEERYIGYEKRRRVVEVPESFTFARSGPQTYFNFIKFQRKFLADHMRHYLQSYEMDENRTIAEFLHELDFGR